jgi:hypothetical protein
MTARYFVDVRRVPIKAADAARNDGERSRRNLWVALVRVTAWEDLPVDDDRDE